MCATVARIPSAGVAKRTAFSPGASFSAPNPDGLFFSRTIADCQNADSLPMSAAIRS